MQSFNVVTRSNANVVACSPANLLGQQAFSGRELSAEKEPPTAAKGNRVGKRSVMLPMRNPLFQRHSGWKGKKKSEEVLVAEEVVEEEKSAGEEEWVQVSSKRGRTGGVMTPMWESAQ